MLVLFAVSIALAVMFPYQGLPPKSDEIATVAVETQRTEVVELGGGGATLQSDAIKMDYDGAHSKSAGNPNDEIIVMKTGQIITEEKVGTSSGEPRDETHVLLSHKEPADESPQAELETHVLFAHQEGKEPADKSPKAKPDDSEGEQEETSCTSLLQQADIDENKMISTSEYLSFLHLMHNSNILSIENLSDEYAGLSFGLRLNFLHQQCKCPPALPECCEDEKVVYVGDESAAAEFCRTTIEVGLDGKARR